MNKNQAAAYVNSQVACALIEAEAMKASNIQACLSKDKVLPFSYSSFIDLLDKYHIQSTAIHEYLFVNNQD